MAKVFSKYVCQQCGYSQIGWAGKCPECGSWGSLVETVDERVKTKKLKNSKTPHKGKQPVALSSVKKKDIKRISTKIGELDRVLGGGIVPGQVILIAGEPGIGKSTILLQLADKLAMSDGSQGSVVYVSGEESVSQIAIRAKRLGVKSKNIQVMEETDIDSIIQTAELPADKSSTDRGKGNQKSNGSPTVIIDSIQTIRTSDLSGMAGSVGQVRECAYRLVRLAKATGISIFIVGHVTKQGTVAGPAVLMHIVDSVLWFEGDKEKTLRMLTARKNRFGPTDEVGIFTMEDKGLVSMSSSDKLFLGKNRKKVSGSLVCSVLKGTRPILIEIQSLVNPTKLAYPRRVAQGIDSKRLEMLLAVLTRRCGVPVYDYDCFVNVAGGISVKGDPSVDLAVCMSIASSYFDKPLEHSTLVLGEVGLLGDIREVIAQEKRIKEAKRLGYKNVISNKEVKYLTQAIKRYLK